MSGANCSGIPDSWLLLFVLRRSILNNQAQTYLSKLMEIQQWNAEYNMQKAQLEESIRQWQAGYDLDVAQFEQNIVQWQASF